MIPNDTYVYIDVSMYICTYMHVYAHICTCIVSVHLYIYICRLGTLHSLFIAIVKSWLWMWPKFDRQDYPFFGVKAVWAMAISMWLYDGVVVCTSYAIWVSPQMEDPQKRLVCNGKSYWNRWFRGTSILGNLHMYVQEHTTCTGTNSYGCSTCKRKHMYTCINTLRAGGYIVFIGFNRFLIIDIKCECVYIYINWWNKKHSNQPYT